jgi:hypothetical protein
MELSKRMSGRLSARGAILAIAVAAAIPAACGGNGKEASGVDGCRKYAAGSAADRQCVQRAFEAAQARAIQLMPDAGKATNHTRLLSALARVHTIETYAFEHEIPLRLDSRLDHATVLTTR